MIELERFHFVASVVCIVFIAMLAGQSVAFSQSLDSDRIDRIRKQLAPEGEPEPLPDDEAATGVSITERIEALEKDNASIKARLKAVESRSAAPKTEPGKNQQSKITEPSADVTICASGCSTNNLQKGINLATSGQTVTVAPGEYYQCGNINKPIKLIGEIAADGTRAHLRGFACGGKAALVAAAVDIVIQGFQISDISVPDRNGACVRVNASAFNVVIRDIVCKNSENGVLGGPKYGSILIEDSYFEGLGKAERAHGLYINGGEEFILRNSVVIASDDGHLVKTGAGSTLIENSVLASLGGRSGRAIDAYAGGNLVVRNSVIQMSPSTLNNELFAFANEPDRLIRGGVRQVLVENNWIIFDNQDFCCRLLFSLRSGSEESIIVRSNKIVGGYIRGSLSVKLETNEEFKDRAAAGLPVYEGTMGSLPKPGS